MNIIDEYNNKLREQKKYKIENGMLMEGSKDIANCLIVITGKKYKENEELQYKLKCISLQEPDRVFSEHTVSLSEFDKFNVIIGTDWEEYCSIEIGNSNRQKMKEIALFLSRGNIKVERTFSHTGFEKINGKEYYLYHGGSLTIEGNEKIVAELSKEGLANYSFTNNKELNVQESIQTSFNCLDLSKDRRIIYPLLSTVYLSPLVSKFEEIGINIDYVIFLVGTTGARKSSTCATFLSHFGSNFNKDNLPASFKGTTGQLEIKSHILKDSLIVVNDFGKEVQGKNKIKLLADLFEIFGDKQSRERMNPNSSLKKTYKARGLAIINGEIVPSDLSESRLARSIILTLDRNSINNDCLTYLQENQDKLAMAMQTYIKWIMANENHIKQKAKDMFKQFRVRQNNEVLGRINDAVNVMEIGFTLFLDFMKKNGVITEERYQLFYNEAKRNLESLISIQKNEVENVNPINMFYKGLDELFQTNKIHVVDYADGNPIKNHDKGRRVGYIDYKEKLYYFYDRTIYDEIVSFYGGKNGDFEISRLDLWRQLANANLLFQNDAHTKKVLRTDPKTNEKISVVAIRFRNIEEYM